MRVGVHCSVRKGFKAALEEAASLGCDTVQLFTQSPRGWLTRVYEDQEFADFRAARARLALDPIVVHAPYLPNLCTTNREMYSRSFDALLGDLDRCEKLGADYLVVHPGAYSPDSDLDWGIRSVTNAFNEALAARPGRCKILIENMAGGGRRVGGTFAEIASILDGVKFESRIGVCFDTCHALAAGYDLSTDDGVDAALNEFDDEIGLERIHVFHVNDSKSERGSHRDMHQHLGRGHIGLSGLRRLFHAPAFRSAALILETPKEPMPQSDLENLRTLRELLA